VFFASGAVLVLEIVGLRLVAPYLGVTLQVSSAVIGIALAAIAYGAWAGGRLADRMDPRLLLAPAFLIAAVATALTLPLVRWAGELLRGSAAGGVLLLAALAVFTPAAFLSAITPLVVKLQLIHLGETGRVVGRLSSIGTLGAITATLLTGFVLVAALPTSVILLGLAAALAVAGLLLGSPWGTLFRRRGTSTMVIVGLVGAGLTAATPNPCDVETAYHCARVQADPERPTGRLLLLNSARHSYVDLADPTHLEFAYAQWVGALIDQLPTGPLRALHIGGGGFTIPRYVAAKRPGSYGKVLELDGSLVALDRSQLGLTTGPDLDVLVGDARVGLGREPSSGYDLVMGDAFGHHVVPWHLTTREFVAEVRRVLRPDGVYALNVIDYPPARFVRAEIATVSAVFGHVAVVAPPDALAARVPSNYVILASDAPLPLDALRRQLAGLPAPVRVLDGVDLAGFVGRGRVLTDDYAPVDQLLNAS
jgi:SAM-dependent methyltransferase